MRVKPGWLVPAVILLMAAAPEPAKQGMPQLDFKNPLVLTQVAWGALIFAVFYLLLSRWGLPKVGAILEMRAETIAGDLERAHSSKAAADSAVAELNAARSQAYAQSQAAIAEATARAKSEAARLAAEQDSRLDAQLAESEAQIARARSSAMGALHEVARDTAEAIYTRLTNAPADAQRLDAAVSELLTDHRQLA